jgi:hypothetical protein
MDMIIVEVEIKVENEVENETLQQITNVKYLAHNKSNYIQFTSVISSKGDNS